jgi:hypothetical protein
MNCEMVGAIGFEPTTPCAQGRCATRLRYAPTLTAALILNYSRALPDLMYAPSMSVIGLAGQARSYPGGRLDEAKIGMYFP